MTPDMKAAFTRRMIKREPAADLTLEGAQTYTLECGHTQTVYGETAQLQVETYCEACQRALSQELQRAAERVGGT